MMTAPGLSSPFDSASSKACGLAAVLGGAGGVEILQLGQKGGVQALCPLDLAELQQGGSPDELLHRGVDSSHSRPPDCKGLHLHGIQ